MPSREPNRDLFARLPRWLQVCLYPVVVVLVAIPTAVAVGLLLFVLCPWLFVQGWLEHRARWKKLRRLGRVVEWPVVERTLTEDQGTLVVEVAPKGPAIAWLVDAPRDVLDPGHVIPNWQQLMDEGYRAIEPPEGAPDAMREWMKQRLPKYANSAQAMLGTWRQLDRLPADVRERSIVAVDAECEGCLSWQFVE